METFAFLPLASMVLRREIFCSSMFLLPLRLETFFGTILLRASPTADQISTNIYLLIWYVLQLPHGVLKYLKIVQVLNLRAILKNNIPQKQPFTFFGRKYGTIILDEERSSRQIMNLPRSCYGSFSRPTMRISSPSTHFPALLALTETVCALHDGLKVIPTQPPPPLQSIHPGITSQPGSSFRRSSITGSLSCPSNNLLDSFPYILLVHTHGNKFSIDEDRAFACSWLRTSEDRIIGSEQTFLHFYSNRFRLGKANRGTKEMRALVLNLRL